ncbi:hypothetical protein AB1N83_013353, partial [Pleurotus pulmonarius]
FTLKIPSTVRWASILRSESIIIPKPRGFPKLDSSSAQRQSFTSTLNSSPSQTRGAQASPSSLR